MVRLGVGALVRAVLGLRGSGPGTASRHADERNRAGSSGDDSMTTKSVGRFARIAGMIVSIAAVASIGADEAFAVTKVIGDFENSLASPYTITVPIEGESCNQAAGTVNWCLDIGITEPIEFINKNDPNYNGGVTSGDYALKFTYPYEWGAVDRPYLRLHGMEGLMNDMADFRYMLMDVTTFAPTVDPETVPEAQRPYRQVFMVLNHVPFAGGTPAVFYDANYDGDVQQDIDIAQYDPLNPTAEAPFTDTVYLDMSGMTETPGVGNQDGKVIYNAIAQFIRTNHNDGTPVPDFTWQLAWPFQGRDLPHTFQISVVVDNIRFCNDAIEVCLAPPEPEGALGDFNDDGEVDAADYVVWRKHEGTATDLPNDGTLTGNVGAAHYALWRENFGEAGSGAGGASGVPEPSALVLAFICGTASLVYRRGRP
jgi:hypothetical protein